ncbi:MAG: N-acetylmuramoyl-L-alanine amidase, partial [Hyphomicrobiaceae bacterium]
YPDFPETQMAAVKALAKDVVDRWSIPRERVLAHSDVAPLRKNDPGEKFDWAVLAAAGVGLWLPPEPVDDRDEGLGLDTASAQVARAQALLGSCGYEVPASGRLDDTTCRVLTAFQRHFRPARVDGRLDASTLGTLARVAASMRSRTTA